MKIITAICGRGLAFLGVFAFMAFLPSVGMSADTAKVVKPRIVNQPAAKVSAEFGSTVNLSVSAASNETPSYVWTKNGAVVPGAVSNTLAILVDEVSDGGRYQVTVRNGGGSVRSRVAQVTVNLAPAGLPAGTALIGSITSRFEGETSTDDVSYVIGNNRVIIDPEDDSQVTTFTYTRLSATTARLVVTGSYFEPELGLRPDITESYLLRFTSANVSGAREATTTAVGTLKVSVGNKSKKVTIKGSGNFSIVPPGLAP